MDHGECKDVKPTTLHPQIAIQQCKALSINVQQVIHMLMCFASSVWKYIKYEQMCHAKL